MMHHLRVGTNDIVSRRKFYDAVLPVVGVRLLNNSPRSANYGAASFLFSVETPVNSKPAMPGNGVHVAFAAGRRAMVDQVYEITLPHSGRDAGPPGLRRSRTPPIMASSSSIDGNKIEAVTYSSK